MAKALDKVTADGHNVDCGLKAIGLKNQRERQLFFGANLLVLLSTMLLFGWMLAPVLFAGNCLTFVCLFVVSCQYYDCFRD